MRVSKVGKVVDKFQVHLLILTVKNIEFRVHDRLEY